MSTAPRRRHKAKCVDSPLHVPASEADNLARTGDTRGWSDSPRQLKQTTQIAQLRTTDPTAVPHQDGLPDGLRRGIESLSGVDMSGVQVHRNSVKAAALGAHAYAQGTHIHLGPGQEKHLPHEAWHVVQQHQGRVPPTHQVAGVAVNGDASLEREADTMGSRAMSVAQRTTRSTPDAAVQRRAIVQRAAGEVTQLSFMSRWRWGDYFTALGHLRCDAIDTGEARTTMEETVNAQGDVTHRIVHLHTYTNDAWGEVGTVTMDRSPRPAVQGPLPFGGGALPGPGYDDRELTLHTAAAGGAGNAGVATHLFPAVLAWIDRSLHGVQQLNMNPAGGAASKSVIAELGARLGDPTSHGHANTARATRKAAEVAARNAATLGGPAVVGIGAAAGAGALNTWDTRLNTEHDHDLRSLDASPHAGLSVSADGMTLAGPAAPADIATMQAQRDFFANTLALVVPDPVINAAHPAAAHFQAAAALTNMVIAADPRSAARILRMARLSSRSGAAGTGGALDAGYQITLGGAALQHLMPNATGP
ncbi:DUF4157 domain-containing protein [Ideonella sp. DXS29W]|uniref:DUF4157 domain-containing protein n=1 Tax=Ideonella lacteola TaxID=2984193 RepID=A0ABU9BZE7_9BURK